MQQGEEHRDTAAMRPRTLRIEGGHPLRGEVAAAGAKNAAPKQFVASLMSEEPCVFRNVPAIAEIDVVLAMLGELGTTFETTADHGLEIHTRRLVANRIGERYQGVNRIPVLLIAPLLHRLGAATVPAVGGCRLGSRPIDFHLSALQAMGAEITVGEREVEARAPRDGLRGTTVRLPYPSVGATENTLLAAVLARGTTVIDNAAIEPEVLDTILFLQKMGALIGFDADRRIVIDGVPCLRGTEHHVVADRMEVASYALAAIATGGRVSVRHARQDHLVSFLTVLRRLGGTFQVDEAGITFSRDDATMRAVQVETGVHPGFMTDWQQPLVAALTRADGVSVVHETVFEDRFGYTDQLRAMGASIELSPTCMGPRPCRFDGGRHLHSCRVTGPTRLRPGQLTAPDLRGGVACVLAALMAGGTSEVHRLELIERGYSNLPRNLAALGAAVEVTGAG